LLWCGGDWVARRVAAGHSLIPSLAGSLLLTTFAANLISSGSFYFFSGRFAETSVLEFLPRITQYAPAYVGYAAMYVGAATVLYLLFAPQKAEQLIHNHDKA